ncbi:MAG: adenosine kinase, partial [Candidatus Thermoplasmatota archaeon]|nr:adenosine kinase [Candidatus Thermoplasmatota archaeon]
KNDIDFELLSTAKYFYFTGYMWDTEEQKGAILSAIDFCNDRNIKIVFDVADPFAVNRNRDEFLELIKHHIHVVFANREEAKILFQENNVEKCAKKLASIVSIGIVKDGSNGSVVQSGNMTYQIPVFPVKAIDSTGAGDMYAAGFLYGLVKNYPLEDSGKCASWLASRIVMQYGAQFDGDGFNSIRNATKRKNWEIT